MKHCQDSPTNLRLDCFLAGNIMFASWRLAHFDVAIISIIFFKYLFVQKQFLIITGPVFN